MPRTRACWPLLVVLATAALALPASASAAAGDLDTTFGAGTGLVKTDFTGSTEDQINGIAIQSDGKIVTAGFSHDQTGDFDRFAVARYNADGSLDTSFNS